MTSELRKALLAWFRGQEFPTPPAMLYVGLHISERELAGDGYARAPLKPADLSKPDDAGRCWNTTAVAGPVALGFWGTPDRVGIYSVPTGGAPLLDGSWEGGPIGPGQAFYAAPGKIVIAFD